MRRTHRIDTDTDTERLLDRRFEQEPDYGKRQRIPLVETGTLKARFSANQRQAIPKVYPFGPSPSCWERWYAEDNAPAEKPPVVPPPVEWSPYDRSAA